MFKQTVLLAAVPMLACSSLDGRIDANSFDSGTNESARAGTIATGQVGVEGGAVGADCPAKSPENAGQSASLVWLDGFGDAPATSPASVAIDARNDAYMTIQTGGTVAVAADGSVLWTKAYGALVAVNREGEVVVAGSFRDSLTLDSTTLTSSGGSDVFVVVLDASGHVLRSVVLGGASDEDVSSLAVASGGRVFLSGAGLGTVALDSVGNVTWHADYVGYLAADVAGNLAVTGSFTGTQSFGGDPLTSAGGEDVFVVKLDGAGNHLFSRRYGDAGGTQAGQAIALDSQGNVLVAGIFDGSVDFGLGALARPACPPEAWCKEAGFVAKLDSDGNTLFSRSRGPMRELSGIAATSSDAIVLSGSLPGDAEPYRRTQLSALSALGDVLWDQQEWPETGLGGGHGVAVDHCDDLRWVANVRPTLDANEQATLAMLSF